MVAMKTTRPDGWGYMSEENGGGHLTEEAVKNWDEIKVPAPKPPKKEETKK